MNEQIMSERQAAKFLNLKVPALRRLRDAGVGPRSYRLKKFQYIYPVADLEKYLKKMQHKDYLEPVDDDPLDRRWPSQYADEVLDHLLERL